MLVIFGCNSVYAKSSCEPLENSKVENAIVKWVYDGDTLLITDTNGNNKRRVRIIGIDTPEVKHHQQKAQMYGAKAREELRVLLKDVSYQVLLEFDDEKHDRYKRLLAHVYLANDTSISEWLLRKGYAKTLTIAPNVKHANCYKNAERLAQHQKIRLWKLKNNQIKMADAIKPSFKGYVRLQGTITDTKFRKKSLILKLKTRGEKQIRVRIKKKNLHYFKYLKPEKLVTQKIIISGILKNNRGKRMITINHPTQLELVTAKNSSKALVAPTIKWSLDK